MADTYTALDLSKTRATLIMRQPFFGSLALRLKYVSDPSVGTLCTNGTEIRFDPKFMARLTEPERQGVIVHELSHCFMGHIFRRNGRDMRTWNKACDFAVNPMIEQSGFSLPREVKDVAGKVIFTGPCLDKKYDGMSAEAIYAVLQQEKQKEQEQKQDEDKAGNKSGTGSGDGKEQDDESASPGGGSGSDAPGDNSGSDTGGSTSESVESQGGNGTGSVDAEGVGSSEGSGTGSTGRMGRNGKTAGDSGHTPSVTGDFTDGKVSADGGQPGDMTEHDWEIAVEQAVCAARQQGKLPGGWVEEIQATRIPKMDPWTVIEQFVDHEIQSDFSWTSPNRRLIGRGLYLPGLVKENIGEIVFAVDTSGSASSEMLTEWALNTIGVVEKFKPSKVHVVMCDTRVTAVKTYEPSEYGDITFQCKGRGGTAFQPVFDWLEEQQIKPVCLVYFTDLYGPMPVEPQYPVLWAVPEYLEHQKGPFGETVLVGVE